jgi:hypothetical protein
MYEQNAIVSNCWWCVVYLFVSFREDECSISISILDSIRFGALCVRVCVCVCVCVVEHLVLVLVVARDVGLAQR